MKKTLFYTILFSFVFTPCFASQQLDPDQLKKVRGQAGIVFQLGEIFMTVKYGDMTYTDTDGYGNITSAGIKIRSNSEYSVLHFMPIKDIKPYTNDKLTEIFGKSIGSVGLVETNIENQNADINSSDDKDDKLNNDSGFILPVSDLRIETTDLCSILTSINLFNNGVLTQLTRENIMLQNLNKDGIAVNLPTVQAEMGTYQKDIMLYDVQPGAMNNEKILLTIEKGPSTQVIFGGKIEITPNRN